jgi:threonine dehydratase
MISGQVIRTPSIHSRALSEQTGAQVFLKLENLQRTGSFKDRGALNKLLSLSKEELLRGVIALSAGNHAQSVAYHAQRLGIAATIVMPKTTPFAKVRGTSAFGARVVLTGNNLADAAHDVERTATEYNLTVVHPYDDPYVIAGQATVALELLSDVPDLDVLVVPVGGGGLISGVAVAAKSINQSIEIVGVETRSHPSLYGILYGSAEPSHEETIAEGIAVKTIGELPAVIARRHVDRAILVGEPELERAIYLLLVEAKTVAEGAGAASLAGVFSEPDQFRGQKVGVIVSGGNIDGGLLASVIARMRLRERLVSRLRIQIDDRPGALARVTELIARSGANVIEVEHRRSFYDLPAKCADLDITLETMTPSDLDAIVLKLHEADLPAIILPATTS